MTLQSAELRTLLDTMEYRVQENMTFLDTTEYRVQDFIDTKESIVRRKRRKKHSTENRTNLDTTDKTVHDMP